MKSTVEKISPTRVKLTVELDSKELADGQQVALHKLAKTLKVAGFRKGKAPLSVAKKHIDDKQLTLEAAENAISKAVPLAFSSNSLQALERPEVEVSSYEPEKSLKFTAETDVMPEVKLPDYKKLGKFSKPTSSVTKKEVDEVVTRIQTQLASKKAVKRQAKTGDEVVIDFVGKKDDVEFDGGKGQDYRLVLGSKTFVPGFEEAVVGHKAGEKFAIDVTFPKDYQSADLAGQKVIFEIDLKDVLESELPAIDDSLAAKVGPYSSVKELTDDIKKELTAQKDAEEKEKNRNEVAKALVAKSKLEVPKVLRDDQIKSIEQDLRQNLSYRGMSLEQYYEQQGHKDRNDWLEKEGNEVAEERVKTALLLAEVSKKEKIQSTSEELAERIGQFKEQYKNDPKTIKQFDSPEVQRDIASRIITEKTIDRLIEVNS